LLDVNVTCHATWTQATQREHFLLQYCLVLASHPTLWQLAPAYLAECPCYGRATLEALVARAPIGGSEVEAIKVLQMCKVHGLRSQEVQIARAVRNVK
jgi:hypothetical protein